MENEREIQELKERMNRLEHQLGERPRKSKAIKTTIVIFIVFFSCSSVLESFNL